jgi:hypothetical protein
LTNVVDWDRSAIIIVSLDDEVRCIVAADPAGKKVMVIVYGILGLIEDYKTSMIWNDA